MIKDSEGNYIQVHSVVVVVHAYGHLYSVEAFDHSREHFVKCRNGCAVSYYKPEHLKCVDDVSDLGGI
jgi:hypothetical protein